MTTIDPSQRLAAALRQQLAALRERAGAQGPGGAARASGVAAPRLFAGRLQQLQGIDPTDPDRHRKAVRCYLEGQLAREFGSAVLNDPVFPQMLDAVQDQMQGDVQTAAAVHALGEMLLAGKAG